MKIKDYIIEMERIASDSSISVDKRIEFALALYKDAEQGADEEDDDEVYRKANIERRIVFAHCLIEMMECEGAAESHAGDLLQLYGILSGALVEKLDYRSIKEIACKVREIVRQEDVLWADVEEAMPVILDAVDETIFYHEAYDLNLQYLRRALKAGCLGPDMKERANRLLKLRVLLEDVSWQDCFFDKELQDAIADMYSSKELLNIIVHPCLGHLRQDPVEFTHRWEEVYYDVEDELERLFADHRRHMGFCFRYWSAKKKLLKDEYGIEWRSPSEMNPRVMFD